MNSGNIHLHRHRKTLPLAPIDLTGLTRWWSQVGLQILSRKVTHYHGQATGSSVSKALKENCHLAISLLPNCPPPKTVHQHPHLLFITIHHLHSLPLCPTEPYHLDYPYPLALISLYQLLYLIFNSNSSSSNHSNNRNNSHRQAERNWIWHCYQILGTATTQPRTLTSSKNTTNHPDYITCQLGRPNSRTSCGRPKSNKHQASQQQQLRTRGALVVWSCTLTLTASLHLLV